jgi:hypothetical protein
MAAPPPLDRFEAFLLTLGRLNYCWTNTESLLIHLIAGLAKCDKETAVVIFLTLNTIRARIDLVERLAKLGRTGEDERETILSLTREMLRLAALRNRYNHCIYAFDPDGKAHSILMRISDRRDAIKMGQMNALDEKALAEIESSIAGLTELNGRIWRAAKRFGFPL